MSAGLQGHPADLKPSILNSEQIGRPYGLTDRERSIESTEKVASVLNFDRKNVHVASWRFRHFFGEHEAVGPAPGGSPTFQLW